MANPWEKYAQQQPLPSPVNPASKYEEPKAAVDIQNVESIIRDREIGNAIAAANLGVSQGQLSISAAANARAEEEAAEKRRQNELKRGADERSELARRENQQERARRAQKTLQEIQAAREYANKWMAAGRQAAGIHDTDYVGAILGQNHANLKGALDGIVGSMAGQLMAESASINNGGVAGMFNTASEARLHAGSLANLDPTQEVEALNRQLDRAEEFFRGSLRNLEAQGYKVGSEEAGQPVSSVNENAVGAIGPKLTAAEAGSDTRGVPIPDEYQAAHTKYLRDNWGQIDPDAYAQFRQMMDERFGFSPDIEAYRAVVPALNERAGQAGVRPEQYTIGPVEQRMSETEMLRNDIVNNPIGQAAAIYANAGGMGIPTLLARDQMDVMREETPWWLELPAEVAGAATGMGIAGRVLGGAAKSVTNPTVAGVLSNPLTADMAYGTVYGATQDENPLRGAIVGGGSALAGNRAGNWIGGKIGGRQAARQDTRNAGEQSVASALAGTDINDITGGLRQAQSMGVPAMAADLSPELNTLGGVAIRSNPTVAGNVRNALGERSAGQYDRLLDATGRNLGPVENIPARSESLMQQASREAAPLYDEAYAAPGASSIDLSQLSSRPSFNRALGQAYNLAAEEGVDPLTLGFGLNELGETTLQNVPSFQTLDYVKRGLDGVIEAETSDLGRVSNLGRLIGGTRADLVSQMDAVNPAYAQARAAYAGPAQAREAMDVGANSLRANPDQLAVDFAKLNPASQEQARLGFQSAIANRAGAVRDASNPFDAVFGNPAARSRVETLYGNNPEGVASILSQAELEKQLAQSSNRLIGNSATAERMAADEAFNAANSGIGDDLMFAAIEAAASGGLPIASGARALFRRSAGNKMSDKKVAANAQRAEEVAPLILNTDTAATIAALEDLAARTAAQEELVKALTSQRSLQGARIGGVGGASVAGALLGQ